MNQRIRRTVPALAVAIALGASSLLFVAATGHGSAPVRGPGATTTPPPACQPPPASCGSESIDEFVIHAANEAARRMIEQQTTGTTTVTNPAP